MFMLKDNGNKKKASENRSLFLSVFGKKYLWIL